MFGAFIRKDGLTVHDFILFKKDSVHGVFLSVWDHVFQCITETPAS
jgi:hypothetical protein